MAILRLPTNALTGYAVMDEAHAGIVDLLNDSLAALDAGRTADFRDLVRDLRAAMADHFVEEEAMMEGAGYLGLIDHRSHHASFLVALDEVIDRCEASGWMGRDDVHDFYTVMMRDILEHDMRFTAFLDKKRQRDEGLGTTRETAA